MPIALSRRHIPVIQATSFLVSEKTDGVRYMLLVRSDGVYLIDRSFRFYFVPGMEMLCSFLAHRDEESANAAEQITLLDGELVRHLQTKKPVFMIFDVVTIKGECVAEQTLDSMLKKWPLFSSTLLVH
jgi:hypothetical protein